MANNEATRHARARANLAYVDEDLRVGAVQRRLDNEPGLHTMMQCSDMYVIGNTTTKQESQQMGRSGHLNIHTRLTASSKQQGNSKTKEPDLRVDELDFVALLGLQLTELFFVDLLQSHWLMMKH
jgi:hypothetical protein